MINMFLKKKSKRELFKEMYEENFQYIYSFVYSRLAGRVDSVEDIVQNVFMSAMNSIDRFKGKSSYRTWLCEIARYKVMDYYRKEVSFEAIEYMDEINNVDSSLSLEDIVINEETKAIVIKILNKLPSIYKFVLILKYIDNYSVKEIADIFQRTPKAIDGILQRGKIQFKNEFLKLKGADFYER